MSAVPVTSSVTPFTQPLDMAPWSQNHLQRVEQALSQWVGTDAPAGLGDAMRYAVLDGGKRLRPLLVLAAHEAVCSRAPAPANEAPPRARRWTTRPCGQRARWN
jgi:farnesyl diphosphate synthase